MDDQARRMIFCRAMSFTLSSSATASRHVSVFRSAPPGPATTFCSVRNGVLVPGERTVALAGVATQDDLLEWTETCDDCEARWALRTAEYEIAWPRGWTLRAGGPPWPWELALAGSSDDLIYLRGPVPPSRIPPPHKAAGPGMTLAGQGADPWEWFELAYEVDGVPFRQRSYVLPVDDDAAYLLTAQAAETAYSQMVEAGDLVVASFVILEP